ncbi:MAG: Rieske 2Fe-2S domain-containing protein, partial [Anaerolineae bacterium]
MTFKKAANVRDILPGRVQVVEVEGEEIALCNVGGEFFAVANLCTHDDGPLGEGQVMDHQVE